MDRIDRIDRIDRMDIRTVHELFEKQAEFTPELRAIICDEITYSYRELNEKANQLAFVLKNHGLFAGDIVAVCFERTPDLIMSLLAILKLGLTYLPISPQSPLHRVRHILDDSRAKLLITNSDIAVQCKEAVDKTLIFEIDKLRGSIDASPKVNFVGFDDNQLAYIIYTSGSTGKPKGVMVEHESIINRLSYIWREFPFSNDEVCCLQANIDFVDAVWEIFGPLLQGIPLVLFSEEVSLDAIRLVKYLNKYAITRFNTTPSFLVVLLSEHAELNKVLPKIKHWQVSGELFPEALIIRFLKVFKDVVLLDRYGSTEATSIIYRLLSLYDGKIQQKTSIIPQTTIHILDEKLQTVKTGEVGELCVSGKALAKGYVNLPQLTSEKFLAGNLEHLQISSSECLYCTGDLAAKDANGNIKIHGRKDNQINLHGVRIELGEIEAVLFEHEEINQVAVICSSEDADDRCLIAYLNTSFPKNMHSEFIQTLPDWMSERLPFYMHPRKFIILEQLPVNSHGKIDKKALPLPEDGILLRRSFTSARTKVEKLLCGLWQKILVLTEVGIEDNFFMLGGHSMMAMKFLLEVRRQLDVELTLKEFFSRPTIKKLALYIENKSVAKSEIEGFRQLEYPKHLPLTASQHRIMFFEKLTDIKAAYNIVRAIRIPSLLNKDKLKRAFSKIVQDQDALRTMYYMNNGKFYQKIIDQSDLKKHMVLMEFNGDHLDQSELYDYLLSQSSYEFDLCNELPVRFEIISSQENETILLLILHHIISDDWSVDIFFKQLFSYYNDTFSNKILKKGLSQPTFIDYCFRQEKMEASGAFLQQLNYWCQYLDKIPESINLPFCKSRPKERNYLAGTLSFDLEIETTNKLENIIKTLKTTPFVFLLTCFKILLYRYTNQEDIVVGIPATNRKYLEFEKIIGLFVNNLAIRTRLCDHLTFMDILEQVKTSILDGYENQDISFNQVINKIGIQHTQNINPIYQVWFDYAATSQPYFAENGFNVTEIELPRKYTKFDLSLIVKKKNDGYTFKFEYAKDIFSLKFVQQLSSSFQELLEQLNDVSCKRIEQFEILSAEVSNEIISTSSGGSLQIKECLYVSKLFEQHAIDQPDHPAVIEGNNIISFKELNIMANRLAHYLIEHLATDNKVIGICLNSWLCSIVSILAVFKAGGAYCFIDLTLPQARISQIVNDANLQLIINCEETKNYFDCVACPQINYDEIVEQTSFVGVANPTLHHSPNNIAYIVYTSGSTGVPKGVMIGYSQISNYLLGISKRVPISQCESYFSFASLSTDFSYTTLFISLAFGKTLCCPNTISVPIEPDEVKSIVTKRDIYCIKITPSLLEKLLTTENPELILPKKCLILGGESSSKHLISKLRSICKDLTIINHYGPTETTIGCCTFELPKATSLEILPIGKPISNTQIYILDKALQLVPRGVVGEIYIGGMGVAKGYWKRDELTAERFVANPFMTEVDKSLGRNDRLYHTGDLGRYLVDGNIEFLGRSDAQVKLRGFRIELGEIESVIQSHENVKQVLVRLITDSLSVKRLVAYIIPGDFEPTAKELQSYLSTKLPNYMVPSAYVLLSQFPLLPNGKIDRESLPLPVSFGVSEEVYVEPATEIEKLLSQLWSEILGVSRVGVNDNFFELGGDSIISIQLISRARQQGIKLAVKDVFEYPTIAGLSQVATMVEQTLPSDVVIETGVTVPMTPIQRWFFSQDHGNYHYNNQAILLVSQEPLDSELLQQALKFLVGYHDGLRLRYEQKKGKWRQYYSDDFTFGYKDEVFSGSDEESWLRYLKELSDELQSNLDLNLGPVFRVAKIQHETTGQEYVFLVLHHLLVDGVSWRILLEDLATVYKQLQAGNDISLDVKTTSYGEWSEGLVDYVHSQELKAELNYWQQIPHQTKLELPVDKSCSDERLGCEVNGKLSKSQTDVLLTKVPRAYQTQINDVLLTALVQAVGDWSGDYNVLINVEGHGREDVLEGVDISRTVGWFTTIYPVHLQLSSDDMLGSGSSLQHIKEQLRAVPEKGIGYGILRYLQTDVNLTHAQVRISFNYLGQWDTKGAIGDLFSYAEESTGRSTSQQNVSPYWIDINAIVKHGQFQIRFGYNKKRHNEATMTRLCAGFIERLQQLIVHCVECNSVHYTPSDFPMINLSQKELDKHIQPLGLIEDIYPLSPMQSGLLFQSLYEPDSSAYFVQSVYKLVGTVDGKALKRAWEAVIAHYGVLRTGFIWEELSEAVQVVLKEVVIDFEQYDWRGKSAAEQEHSLADLLEKDRQRGFCLCNPPLIRMKLIHLDQEVYYCIWSKHHLIIDGWSSSNIWKDVSKAYSNIILAKPPELDPVISYKDYIGSLSYFNKEEAKTFWQEQLSSFSSPIRLTNRFKEQRIDEKKKDIYQRYEFIINEKDTFELKETARKHQVTLSVVVQSAWLLLLYHYTNQTKLTFGVTVSGRSVGMSGIDNCVGLFINTLPLCLTITPGMKLSEMLKLVQNEMVKINQYSYLSLAEIQTYSKVDRTGRDGLSLFDHILVFENHSDNRTNLHDNFSFKYEELFHRERTEYPLTIIAVPENIIKFRLLFNEAYFKCSEISCLAEYFQSILSGITSYSGLIDNFDGLNETITNKLLHEWNPSYVRYPQNSSVCNLFEEQVEKNPNKLAIKSKNKKINYGQLNCQANKWANYLKNLLNNNNKEIIAVLIPQSFNLITALIAIFKSGNAYLPISIETPIKRLQFMLNDSGAKVLITSSEMRNIIEENEFFSGCTTLEKVVYVDEINDSALSAENLGLANESIDLAYIIYTSGTTGQPKGVLINQKGIIRLVKNTNYITISSKHNIAQAADISFDASTFEIWGAMLNGAALILADKDTILSADKFENYMVENRIDVLWLTTSLFNYMYHENRNMFHALEYLLVGGEALNPKIINEFIQNESCMPKNLINGYGPTENTTFTTTYNISREGLNTQSVPIGKPITNTKVYIVNANMNLVPIGVKGEICVTGDGLSNGYLNHPNLNEEKFINNPFVTEEDKSSDRNLKIYKTGDVGAYLPDGNIEFYGRIDKQVKVRGYRIELEEIESVINRCKFINESVALNIESELLKENVLVGFVVLKNGKQESDSVCLAKLDALVKQHLPSYMMPEIVIIDSLPLTIARKVNSKLLTRQYLDKKDFSFVDDHHHHHQRTTSEEILSSIWSKLLNVRDISSNDNFFHLGGHSLLVMQLRSAVRKGFEVDLSYRDIFTYSTLSELAGYIDSLKTNTKAGKPKIQKRSL